MKSLFAILSFLLISLASCGGKTDKREHEQVIATDTVDTIYKVEKTVVETDTTINVDTVTKTDKVDENDSVKK